MLCFLGMVAVGQVGPLADSRMASLALFAWLLTLVEAEHAGRAYAAYGGIYIAASVLWLWLIEGAKPDRWDVIGGSICLAGAALIFLGPRHA